MLRAADAAAAAPTQKQPRDPFGEDDDPFSEGSSMSDDDKETFDEQHLDSLLHGLGAEAVDTQRERAKHCSWDFDPNADSAMASKGKTLSSLMCTGQKTIVIVTVNSSAWSTVKDYLQHDKNRDCLSALEHKIPAEAISRGSSMVCAPRVVWRLVARREQRWVVRTGAILTRKRVGTAYTRSLWRADRGTCLLKGISRAARWLCTFLGVTVHEHTSERWSAQNKDLFRMLAEHVGQAAAWIVAGDFNMEPKGLNKEGFVHKLARCCGCAARTDLQKVWEK